MAKGFERQVGMIALAHQALARCILVAYGDGGTHNTINYHEHN